MVKIQTIEKLFFYTLIFSYLLVAICIFFTPQKKKIQVIIAIYGILFCILLLLWDYLPTRNLKIVYQYFYTTAEYLFFAYFLWYSIERLLFRKIMIVLSLVFILFQIAHYLITNQSKLDSISVGIETILLFIFIFFLFLEYFQSKNPVSITATYSFWVSVGVLFYLGGSFFFNILANNMDQTYIDKYWYFTYIAETLKNIMFIIAVLVAANSREKKVNEEKTNQPYLDMI